MTLLKIALPSSSGFDFISVKQILWCESDGNFTWTYTMEGKKILITKLLKQMDVLLKPYSFCRIHHKYIVNLDHLTRYEKGDGGRVVMIDNTCLPVSRDKKREFLNKIITT